MEIIVTLIIGVAGLLLTVFNRTDKLLEEIRDTLGEIRDGLEDDRHRPS